MDLLDDAFDTAQLVLQALTDLDETLKRFGLNLHVQKGAEQQVFLRLSTKLFRKVVLFVSMCAIWDMPITSRIRTPQRK